MPNHALLGDSPLKPRFDEQSLAEMAHQALNRPVTQVNVAPLQGDASTRQYFRLSLTYPEGFPEPATLILMQLEKPETGGETDFIRILKFLQSVHQPVPELFGYDAKRGLLLLQDCGDTTLEAHLKTVKPESTQQEYVKAVHLLAEMQTRATQAVDVDCPAYHLKFDVEKLMWEMDFMLEHFVEGLRQNPLDDSTRQTIREHLTALCEILAEQPVWFTHRDYHSRNLMVYNGNLVLLDFQDARMGPSQYDLVSLLRDSYGPLPDSMVGELIDTFLEKKQALGNPPDNREEFLRIFDIMSIQRNLKAVGTFAFQKHVNDNDRYLQYIAPTLNTVRQTFRRRTELKTLHSVLSNVIPELNP